MSYFLLYILIVQNIAPAKKDFFLSKYFLLTVLVYPSSITTVWKHFFGAQLAPFPRSPTCLLVPMCTLVPQRTLTALGHVLAPDR